MAGGRGATRLSPPPTELIARDLAWPGTIRARPAGPPLATQMSSDHIDDLRAQAEYARQRFELYKAKAYGQRPTSPVRMRELERIWEQAQARLRAAEAEEQASGPPSPGDGAA